MADAAVPLPPGSYDSRVPTTVGVTINLSVSPRSSSSSVLTRGDGSSTTWAWMTFGLGHHVWMLPNPEVDVPLYLRSFYVSIVLYCAGLLTMKLTFLTQYYRVFGVGTLRRIFMAAILVVGAWSLSQVLIGIFICWPIRGFWDHTLNPPARCVPNNPQFYVNAAGSVGRDEERHGWLGPRTTVRSTVEAGGGASRGRRRYDHVVVGFRFRRLCIRLSSRGGHDSLVWTLEV